MQLHRWHQPNNAEDSQVYPVYKMVKLNSANYHSIHLISIMSKMMEGVIDSINKCHSILAKYEVLFLQIALSVKSELTVHLKGKPL